MQLKKLEKFKRYLEWRAKNPSKRRFDANGNPLPPAEAASDSNLNPENHTDSGPGSADSGVGAGANDTSDNLPVDNLSFADNAEDSDGNGDTDGNNADADGNSNANGSDSANTDADRSEKAVGSNNNAAVSNKKTSGNNGAAAQPPSGFIPEFVPPPPRKTTRSELPEFVPPSPRKRPVNSTNTASEPSVPSVSKSKPTPAFASASAATSTPVSALEPERTSAPDVLSAAISAPSAPASAVSKRLPRAALKPRSSAPKPRKAPANAKVKPKK
jgi:hypothetical protein